MSLWRILTGGAGGGSALADFGLLVLRVITGWGLIKHGLSKLPPGHDFIELVKSLHFPDPTAFAWAAGLSEFLGGVLIGVGLFTRLGAFFALSVLLVAITQIHINDPFARSELAWIYTGILVFVLFAGAGRYAFEKTFVRQKPAPAPKRASRK